MRGNIDAPMPDACDSFIQLRVVRSGAAQRHEKLMSLPCKYAEYAAELD